MSKLYEKLGDKNRAQIARENAGNLSKAILKHCIAEGAPGADVPIYADATDGKKCKFVDVPPGSLMKAAAARFVA